MTHPCRIGPPPATAVPACFICERSKRRYVTVTQDGEIVPVPDPLPARVSRNGFGESEAPYIHPTVCTGGHAKTENQHLPDKLAEKATGEVVKPDGSAGCGVGSQGD